ncbi:MAG: peptidase S8/S53 subtilisin kexin sedolisin [Alphaproteobacteria bacterium]|nr:peptidase S8/S53 subtilisin kexin sedolisin [Alphaproteobacteria bacterium]MDE2013841.1 peptidase S8/S53 subtilisin kexin sedolisin [Alphaproteobacteria bacterium]MDE2074547.1 peptidase S8/S53 subtilisin kexin sedolisin [Alphaproteobacteria bacterium]
MSVRVGLVDSGLGPEHRAAAAVHIPAQGALMPVRPDASGHGSDMARIILAQAPEAELVLAQVFDGEGATSPARVAAGLEWCVEQGAQVIALCLGLRRDEPVLRAASARAAAAGVDLIASAAARGAPVYPAAYEGVISVCGDARCAPGEVSALGGVPAEFGACHVWGPRRGASCAAASVTGLVAAWRARGRSGQARAYLTGMAAYHGREHRT